MKRKLLLFTLIFIIASLLFSAIIFASESNKSAEKEKVKIEKAEKVTGETEKGKEEGGEEGEAEAESAWRIPGWQTIFTIIAVGYFILIPLNILPMLAAKELEEHH